MWRGLHSVLFCDGLSASLSVAQNKSSSFSYKQLINVMQVLSLINTLSNIQSRQYHQQLEQKLDILTERFKAAVHSVCVSGCPSISIFIYLCINFMNDYPVWCVLFGNCQNGIKSSWINLMSHFWVLLIFFCGRFQGN